jgi:ABC-type branched-subunit amino acid transport system substrate-binding protein
MQKLAIEDGVTAILGPLTNRESEWAFERAEVLRVPVISMGTKEDLQMVGRYSFRAHLSLQDQAQKLAQFLANNFGSKRVALLVPDTSYGWDVADRAMSAFRAEGLTVADIEVYASNATDFKDPLRRMTRLDRPRLRRAELCPKDVRDEQTANTMGCVMRLADLKPIFDFDTLLIADFAETASFALPTLPYLKLYGVQVVGMSGFNSSLLIERAGTAAEGVIFTDSYDASSMSSLRRFFFSEFERLNNRKPSRVAVEAFDLAMIALDVMTRDEKGVSRELFMDRLRRIQDFQGVSGVIGYRDQHLLRKPELMIVRNNEIRPLR